MTNILTHIWSEMTPELESLLFLRQDKSIDFLERFRGGPDHPGAIHNRSTTDPRPIRDVRPRRANGTVFKGNQEAEAQKADH